MSPFKKKIGSFYCFLWISSHLSSETNFCLFVLFGALVIGFDL